MLAFKWVKLDDNATSANESRLKKTFANYFHNPQMEKQLLAIQVKQPFLTRSVNAILSLYKDPESKAHFMEASLTSD